MTQAVKQTKPKRADKHEPTPEETLVYIGDAVTKLTEEVWKQRDKDGIEDYSYTSHEEVYGLVTLGAIRRKVAERMAAKKEYFSKAYRHKETPLHRAVFQILGSTVLMNALIDGRVTSK